MRDKIIEGERLNYKEAVAFITNSSDETLYSLAKELREHFLGRNFGTCMIMNAKSGRCSEDCKWCSQSKYHQTDVEVYDLVKEPETLAQAKLAEEKGVHRFSLVTSGRKLSPKQVKKAAILYKRAQEEHPNVSYCASMGLLNKAELQDLYDAGVRRYHCNIETAPSHFPSLCSTHTQAEKMQTINWAREVGMDICSGGIIGMGESEEQRIEMACYLQEMGVQSIPLNILIPIQGTQMQDTPALSDRELLRTFALFRIINPTADIRLAGGRVRIQHIQDQALECGISSSMVGNLLTTNGLAIDEDIKHIKSLNYNL